VGTPVGVPIATQPAAAEPVEIVDPDGEPVGVTTRGTIRATNARHRATYIVVTAPHGTAFDDMVLVHQRAAWKDIWPSRWDIAFGGICNVGEPWIAAAVRELAEEAGVAVDPEALIALGPVRFESSETRVVGQVYRVAHAGPFTFPDGEVEAFAWVPLDALATFASTHALCADSEAVVLPLVASS
jgi:8-oxo-dGTP pyrophosphatase MutT (NUDIX family)